MIELIIENIKKKYAPDRRTALFDITVAEENGAVKVKGETNLPEAKAALLAQLREENFNSEAEIQLLPSEALQGKTVALVNISVANLRSNPKHAAELATQATLGTPLNVLKQQENWFLVQTPDEYISWVDSGGIFLLTENELTAWRQSERVIYTRPYGFSFTEADENSQTVSDLVKGNVLKMKGEAGEFYEVNYPDGRQAFVPKNQCQPLSEWLRNLSFSPEQVAANSRLLMGLPYLWGGTSFKGVDCSGFTRIAYFLNGYLLPRDASQQVHLGETVETGEHFERLEPGDLLFFGTPATADAPEKVVHVALWLGKGEFIHASGMVRINSFDPQKPNYNEYELKRFLRAKRLAGNEGSAMKKVAEMF